VSYTIAYGTETESLEDPDQLVLVTGPDEWADLDSDDLVQAIRNTMYDEDSLVEPLVGIQQVLDALELLVPAVSGIHPSHVKAVLEQLTNGMLTALLNQ
jgi:hypothetical protein